MQLARLGWVLAAIAAIAFVVVMVALLRPLTAAGHTARGGRAAPASEGTMLFLFASAVPALVLLAMYAFSLRDTGHLTASTTGTTGTTGAAVRASVRIAGYPR